MIKIHLNPILWLVLCVFMLMNCQKPINRKQVVRRHRVTVDTVDVLSSLSVGNGRFAFTVDFTGLQSFPAVYEQGIPLGTQSEWGWHSFPDTAGYTYDETLVDYNFYGRKVPYAVQVRHPRRKAEAVNYFRQNPHRLHLGIIGLDFFHPDGTLVEVEEIKSIHQTLDPWTGEIVSSFTLDETPVEVTTVVHPEYDLVASRIQSSLLEEGRIRVKLHFPYPSGGHSDSGCDWIHPEKHHSVLNTVGHSATIRRRMDDASYGVTLQWSGTATIHEEKEHFFYLEPDKGQSEISFSCFFALEAGMAEMPDFAAAQAAGRKSWEAFWMSGGAVDFSGSTDPRAPELERRIVLSQYLTRLNCAGNYPPQETGLTYNSWHGKFHLEMHWWHGVHFPLWNRSGMLEQSLDYYMNIAERARQRAHRQQFDGVRWPKMTSPSGMDSPSGVGSFLIWQQPHFIYLAELCYRDHRDEEFLRNYAELVFETADFMASYAHYDTLRDRYVLGPHLIPAQERFPSASTINPPFELAYWREGLILAQQWQKRLNGEPRPEWEEVIEKLSPLPELNGMYLGAESAPDSYTNPRYMSDHPMVVGTCGMFPLSPMIDFKVMKKTFEFVWNNWHWEETWGWDFPMTAMAATRLGMPEKAIEALFMDVGTNTYLPNGHNYQNNRLRLYLPGNGALLTAVAMMCAGYEGCEEKLPGFPKDGTWKVQWEGLKPMH
jgi:protein-glucosylgalactosylhydroxylysine glucosidase